MRHIGIPHDYMQGIQAFIVTVHSVDLPWTPGTPRICNINVNVKFAKLL